MFRTFLEEDKFESHTERGRDEEGKGRERKKDIRICMTGA